MNWIVLLLAFEVGMVPNNGWVMQEAQYHEIAQPQYYTAFEVEAEAFGHLFIGGGVRTRMRAVDNHWTFSPYSDEYRFGAGMRWGPVEIGFRHLCTHPVIPYITSSRAEVQYEGSYDELYLRVEVDYGK